MQNLSIPTEQEIKDMINEVAKMHSDLFDDVSNANRILEKAQFNQARLSHGYKKEMWSELRALANKELRGIISAASPYVTAKVPTGEPLTDDLKRKVNEVRAMISRMAFIPDREYLRGEDKENKSIVTEKDVNDAISALVDYGRGIASDHSVIRQLREQFHARKADNTIKYLQSPGRNEKRDEALLKYYQEYGAKYNQTQLQTILNILESRVGKTK